MSAPAKADTHVLYRFYDANSVLLYIGITRNPPARFKGHATEKAWWDMVAHIKMETLGSRDELAAAERYAIITEVPRFNVTHNGTRRYMNSDPTYSKVMPLIEDLLNFVRAGRSQFESDDVAGQIIPEGKSGSDTVEMTYRDLAQHHVGAWALAINDELSRLLQLRAEVEMAAIATAKGLN